MIRHFTLAACLIVASSILSVIGQTVVPGCTSTASGIAVPTPWYATPISSNPLAACGGAGTCGYGWQATDPSDSSDLQAIHTNMITLNNGGGTNWVNLTARSGPNSIGGNGPPANLFGESNTGGTIATGTAGWTFEMTFKATAQVNWAKVFDFGNGQCNNGLVYGWTNTQLRNEVIHCTGLGEESKLEHYTPIAVGNWYHVVIVIQKVGSASNQNVQTPGPNNALWYIYVNGVSAGSAINGFQPATRPGPYPIDTGRRDLRIGRSGWADGLWQGNMRHLNIYNQALAARQVDALYRNRMGSNCALRTGDTDTTDLVSTPRYTAGSTTPTSLWALPVNARPSNANDINYGWMQQDTADVSCGLNNAHNGLIVLGGSFDEGRGSAAGGPFINLTATTGPNSIPQAGQFPNIGGDSPGNLADGTFGWTIELTMKPNLVETWAKVFDFANPQVNGVCRNNILAGWQDNGPGWTFSTCDSNGVEYNNRFTSLELGINQWSHVLMVIQKNHNPTVYPQNGDATYLVYLNGELKIASTGLYYPPSMVRTNGFLGRSSWQADFFWDGYIDYFNIYNVAFTAPQAVDRFNAAMGSNTGTNRFYCPVAYNPINTLAFVDSNVLWKADFGQDPRQAAGGAGTAKYSWVQSDSADSSSDQSVHQGLLVLSGASDSFVNLTAASGPNSINIPSIGVLDTSKVGGRETSGNVFNGTGGFTFEITWKANTQPTWAKLFDIGALRTGGNCNYDIFFGWHAGDAQDLDFQICDYDGSQFGPAPFTNTLGTLNTWHHFVAVITQTMNGRANYSLWMDGAIAWSGTNQYYPTALPRPNALLGDSNWADANWQGYVDTFVIYKQALNPTQVGLLYSRAMVPVNIPTCSSTASQVPVPAPWYSLNVTTDPRAFAGGADQAAYGWKNVDELDPAVLQPIHQGLIVLGGGAINSNSQFVNLSTRVGPNTIGTTFNGFIGGSGAIDALAAQGTAGWTFEVTVKPTARATWGKIFDFGNPQVTANGRTLCRDDILMGWTADTQGVQFDYCDNKGMESSIYTGAQLQIGQWYHITGVMQQLVGPDGQGTAYALYVIYINNVWAGSISGPLPTAVFRRNAMIGRSSWADAYYQGMLDSLNIYNYALNARQVNALYLQKLAGCGTNVVTTSANFGSVAAPFSSPSVSATPPNPLWSLPTDTRPANTDSAYFNWVQQDEADVPCGINSKHQGIIQLGGSSNPGYEGPYLNLSATSGPRSIASSQPFPLILGGPGPDGRSGDLALGTRGWSFAFMMKPMVVEEWAKLFDFGNPQVNGRCRDDIFAGWEGYGPEWTVSVCDDQGNERIIGNAFGNVNVTDWTHAVVVIQQNSDGTGNYYTYTNGKLTGAVTNAYYPPAKPRYNSFMGRSGWSADSYWDGYIDSFDIYSYALTAAQINTLWNSASNNGQLATTCTAPTPTSGLIDSSNLLLDLTFDSDPRPAAGGIGVARFGWNQTLSNDNSDNQRLHKGLLYLAGGGSPNAGFNGNYVNLTERSGPTFIGKTLDPWAIGDTGRGNENAGTAGWTFETTFKPTTSANWGKIFDLGGNRPASGSCRFDILFGQMSTDANRYSFSSCDQRGNEYGLRPALDNVVANQWNHAVLIIELGPAGQGIYQVYLNGRLSQYIETQGWYPTILPRINGMIGRSNWGADDYWGGYIDTFRIYSVAATTYQVDTLYRRAMVDPNYNPVDPGAGSSSSSSSGLSGGAIAGIVIGSIVGALILIVIALVLCCGLGSRSKKSSSSDYDGNKNASHKFDEMEASRNVEMSNVQGEHDTEETV